MSDGGRVKAAWGAKAKIGGLVGKRRRARVQVLDSGKIAGVIELRASLPEQIGREIDVYKRQANKNNGGTKGTKGTK